jgi:hypothetical protein
MRKRRLVPVAAAAAVIAAALAIPPAARFLRLRSVEREAALWMPVPVDGWPQQVSEIRYASTADYSVQPALFYDGGGGEEKRPLLVALHTWSGDYLQAMSVPYARWCVENGWAFIHPNFRGPNWTPEAAGSDLVVGDIISAVEYARKRANADEDRIYLAGVSGGGHAALLMAGRAPKTWAGVTAWVPISDLAAWHDQCVRAGREYSVHIEKSCGGPPGRSVEIDRRYRRRSPLTWLKNAKGLALDINAGIRDGRDGSVPVSHSLLAFNEAAEPADRFSAEEIRHITDTVDIPARLRRDIADPAYANKRPLLRRTSGRARVTIFDGGHEIVFDAALKWLSQQEKTHR